MMVGVFVGFSKILLGFLVKGFLATERAEIIRLPLVFGYTGSGGGIDIHVANGIVYSGSHKRVSFSLNYAIKRQLQREPYYGCLHRQFCLSYFPISYPACSHATMPPSRFQIFIYPSETSSVAAISLMRPLRQYNTILAFLSVGSWFILFSGTDLVIRNGLVGVLNGSCKGNMHVYKDKILVY